MICPKCNLECKDNFCIKCGYMKNDGISVQIGTKEPLMNDIKMYISNETLKKSTNIYAGIFGPFYLCYIKLYLVSAILLIINLILFYLFFNYLDLIKIFVLKIISFFIYCSVTNQIYYLHAKRKISHLKSKYETDYKNHIKKSSEFKIMIPFIYLFFVIMILLFIIKIL